MKPFQIVKVTHHNGTVVTGLRTGGDENGIFVQRSGFDRKPRPVFCDWQNIAKVEVLP